MVGKLPTILLSSRAMHALSKNPDFIVQLKEEQDSDPVIGPVKRAVGHPTKWKQKSKLINQILSNDTSLSLFPIFDQ